MNKSIFSKSWLQCLLFLIGGGLVSMALKFEVTWDFANYHYYNPWAFFYGNQSDVLALSGLHSFYNPLVDVPLYFMIEYFNDYPNLIYFVQGMSFGILAFVFFLSEKVYFKNINSIIIAFIIGLTGYAVFFQIGTSSNEIQISVFIMLSFLIILRELFLEKKCSRYVFFVAGIFAGIALGLKYTAVIYCASLFLSLSVFLRGERQKLVILSLFVLGGSIGFFCVNGFWMWHLFKEYQNPFFPFLNTVFHSEYWSDSNYYDKRFLPQNLLQFLMFPFDYRRNSDSFLIWDYQLGFCLISLVLLCLFSFFLSKIRIDKKFKFLICFWVSSYVIWISFFAISRYLIPLELASALLLVKTVEVLRPKIEKYTSYYEWLVCILFFVLLLNPLVSGKYGCRNCYLDEKMFDKFMEMKAGVVIPDNTLLVFYNDPGAAILPYLSHQAKNLKGVYIKKQNYKIFCNGMDIFNEIDYWINKRQKIITEHDDGLLVAVIAYQNDETVQEMLKQEELLKGMVCKKIKSNIMPWYHFCVDADRQSEIFK